MHAHVPMGAVVAAAMATGAVREKLISTANSKKNLTGKRWL